MECVLSVRENYSWGEGVSEREWSGVCAECLREDKGVYPRGIGEET